MNDQAWAKKHGPGGPSCPFGDRHCGYCHPGCEDENCGICEDRAMMSVFPQPKDTE